MVRGKVKWFSVDRGFGFIEPEEGGDDVFVHANSVASLGMSEGLNEGEVLEFEVERTPKGLSAENVERVDE